MTPLQLEKPPVTQNSAVHIHSHANPSHTHGDIPHYSAITQTDQTLPLVSIPGLTPAVTVNPNAGKIPFSIQKKGGSAPQSETPQPSHNLQITDVLLTDSGESILGANAVALAPKYSEDHLVYLTLQGQGRRRRLGGDGDQWGAGLGGSGPLLHL